MLKEYLKEYIEKLPKVELHIHLEGSIRPKTLLRLAEENNHPIKDMGIDGIIELYNYNSFEDFLRIFKIISECLIKPKDFYLITYNMLKAQAYQNIIYSEVLFSPGIFVMRGLDFNLIMEEIYRAMYEAQKEYGVYMRLIFDSVRQWGAKSAMDMLNLAKSEKDKGVIGISIGGNEKEAPPELFKGVYIMAKKEGFHLYAHAGEVCGHKSIWDAIKILNVERIGHGIYAYQDMELINYLRDNRIPLDISVTSNIKTGAIKSLDFHPIKRLFDHGILITINSDDPAMFNADLNKEYMLLIDKFNFTIEDIKRLIFNGIEVSFLNREEKNSLIEKFIIDIDNIDKELIID